MLGRLSPLNRCIPSVNRMQNMIREFEIRVILGGRYPSAGRTSSALAGTATFPVQYALMYSGSERA